MNWLPPEIRLTGEFVELLPLQQEHFDVLVTLAEEEKTWEYYPAMNAAQRVKLLMDNAWLEKANGTQYPFVVYHKRDQRIVGTTRLMEIAPQHKKLEIGHTWYHPGYWASVVNPECKLLLLTYCFGQLKALRVQLRTSDKNIRSQTAIAKLGAKREGVLRNDIISIDGSKRNSVYFSIIDEEWPAARQNVMTYLEEKRKLLSL